MPGKENPSDKKFEDIPVAPAPTIPYEPEKEKKPEPEPKQESDENIELIKSELTAMKSQMAKMYAMQVKQHAVAKVPTLENMSGAEIYKRWNEKDKTVLNLIESEIARERGQR